MTEQLLGRIVSWESFRLHHPHPVASALKLLCLEQPVGSFPPRASSGIHIEVVLALLLAALLGTVVAAIGGYMLLNPVLLDIAVTLGLATGILIGAIVSQTIRERPSRSDEENSSAEPIAKPETAAISEEPPKPEEPPKFDAAKISPRLTAARAWVLSRMRKLDLIETIRVGAASAGIAGILFVIRPTLPEVPPLPFDTGIAAALCLAAAGLAAMAARYFATIDPDRLPEGPWLCRGARVVAWILVLGAISAGLQWAGQNTILEVLHFGVLAVDAAVCYGLLTARVPKQGALLLFRGTSAFSQLSGAGRTFSAAFLTLQSGSSESTCAPRGHSQLSAKL